MNPDAPVTTTFTWASCPLPSACATAGRLRGAVCVADSRPADRQRQAATAPVVPEGLDQKPRAMGVRMAVAGVIFRIRLHPELTREVRVLQPVLDGCEEPRGVRAVDDAVVVGQRE